MSVQIQGYEAVTPTFDGPLIDYWHQQSLAPLPEFMGLQREELGNRSIKGALADYSMAAKGLHNRLLDSRFPGNPAVGTPEAQNLAVAKNQHTAGYLLAFVILHQAGLSLDKLSDLYAYAYEERITENPGLLVEDFLCDYPGYPKILDLVDDGMPDTDSQFTAMLMFAIHGGAANPSSPLIKIAEAAEADKGEGQVIVLPTNAELRSRKQERRAEKHHKRPTFR